MTSKLQFLFLFGSITLSLQRGVNKRVQQDIADLTKLIQDLETHNHPANEDHHHDVPHDHHDEHPNLMNIQTLNMFYRNKDKKRGEVKKVPARASKHEADTAEDSNDVIQLLNELETELIKDETSDLRCNSLRCPNKARKCGCRGYGRKGLDKTLRCKSCAINRADRERDTLRCKGNRCGRGSDRTADDRNDRSEYRCRGNRCGGSRNYERNGLSSLSNSGKKYKINDDLDAIVLDLPDLDNLLSKFSDCKDGKCREKKEVNKQNLAIVENVDLNNLIDNVKSHGDVEAIFIDLSQVENSDDLANYIKQKFSSKAENKNKLVTSEDLFNYYSGVKREVGDLILSYIKGDATLNKLSFLPYNVKQKVYNLKLQLEGVDVGDYQVRNEINRIVFERPDTKVLPHGEKNNNFYIPKWLHTGIVQALDNYNLRAQKSLFPLTSKQKQKIKQRSEIRRRTTSPALELHGLPFELNVQGLGQVAP